MSSATKVPFSIRLYVSIIISILASGFCLSKLGTEVDLALSDLFFISRGALNAPTDIVIVSIDDPSFSELKLQWPWPRKLHAQLLDSLFQHGAKVVALDIVFAEPSTEEDDLLLAKAINTHRNIILAADYSSVADPRFVHDIVTEPLPRFVPAKNSIGLTRYILDTDTYVRRMPSAKNGYDPLAIAGATLFANQQGRDIDRYLKHRSAAEVINYLGPSRTFRTVSYYQALDPRRFLPIDTFEGKLVFVGVGTASTLSASQGGRDHFATPFSRFGQPLMSGTEIHANVAANVLSKSYLIKPSFLYQLLAGLVLSVISATLVFSLKPMFAVLVTGIELLLLSIVSYLFFTHYFIQLAPLAVIGITGITYLGSPFLHYFYARKEKAFIRNVFSRYVSAQVVDKLLTAPHKLQLGGERVEATVVFIDLAGFTSAAEQLSPEQIVTLLNNTLGEFSEIILSSGGMIDKYIGDCIMAVWGVPITQFDHAEQACDAALRIVQHLENHVGRVTFGDAPMNLAIRIGINSGPMVAGNVGGKRHFNYTVLGNEVNLASRLEGANRFYGTSCLLGQRTASQLSGGFLLRELDTVRVKGQLAPVTIYELQGRTAHAPETLILANKLYAEGLKSYRLGRWDEALQCFSDAHAAYPESASAISLLKRCEQFLAAPPSEWSGVYVLDGK